MSPIDCYDKVGPKQLSNALPLDPITHKAKQSVLWDPEAGQQETVMDQL